MLAVCISMFNQQRKRIFVCNKPVCRGKGGVHMPVLLNISMQKVSRRRGSKLRWAAELERSNVKQTDCQITYLYDLFTVS